MPSTVKLKKMFGPSVKLARMRADALQPHPLAQREIVAARLRKLVGNLDLDAIGVLHAVEYAIDGKKAVWIIDGQHRWRALMEHGMGEWEVEVKIHSDVTDHQRASALFLKLNDRSPVSPFDKFKNRLSAKEEIAVGINDIAIKHGLRVGNQSQDGALAGIVALEKTYKLDDGKSLDKTLDTTTGAWGRRSIDAKVIEGIGLLYARYDGTIDRAALVNKLSKYKGGPSALVGDARGLMDLKHAPLSRCVAEIVVETYNLGRRAERLDPL